MIITDLESIRGFMNGTSPDAFGRLHSDILSFSDEELEACHDQIQWMFPLHEESAYAETYPILTKNALIVLNKEESIKTNLKDAQLRMRRFYGIGQFSDIEKQKQWCKFKNHNLLRITRIIRCLRLFELDKEAQEFYDAAIKAPNAFLQLDDLVFHFWSMALKDDVWESLRKERKELEFNPDNPKL